MKYHSEGEFLPDRFDFEPMKKSSVIIGGPEQSHQHASDSSLSDGNETCGSQRANDSSEDERVLSAMSLDKVIMTNPFANATGTGVRKFLGVIKPVILYEQMNLWCQELQLLPVPSFTSFRRALRQARPWLRFRKAAGQHGLCDTCSWFKAALRKHQTSKTRIDLVEQFAKHLLQVWRDRQFEASLHHQACQTRCAMLEGTHASSLSNGVPCCRSYHCETVDFHFLVYGFNLFQRCSGNRSSKSGHGGSKRWLRSSQAQMSQGNASKQNVLRANQAMPSLPYALESCLHGQLLPG